MTDNEYPRDAKNLGPGLDVSLSLATVMEMISCPKHGDDDLKCLTQVEGEQQHLKALASLWRDLGRPNSPIWMESRVFWNRIVHAHDKSLPPKVHNPPPSDAVTIAL